MRYSILKPVKVCRFLKDMAKDGAQRIKNADSKSPHPSIFKFFTEKIISSSFSVHPR